MSSKTAASTTAILVLLAVSVPGTAHAAAGDVAWSSTLAGSADRPEGGSEVAMSPDGATSYVVADPVADATAADPTVIAYETASGDQEWVKTLPLRGDDRAGYIEAAPDGSRLIVTGQSGQDHVMTFALRPSDGKLLWKKTWDGVDKSDERPSDLALTPSGSRAIVVGSDDSGGALFLSYATSNGALAWSRRVKKFEPSTVDATGTRAVVGGASPGPDDLDATTHVIRTKSGATLWNDRYDSGEGHDWVMDVEFSPDGGSVAVAGTSATSGGEAGARDVVTTLMDAATGDHQWEELYDSAFDNSGSGGDDPAGLVFTPDGSAVIVAALSLDEEWHSNWSVFSRLVADGSLDWEASRQEYLPDAIAITPGGGTVVVSGGETDGWQIAAYDAGTGGEMWNVITPNTQGYANPGDAVAITPNGAIAVVTGELNRDVETMAFALV